MIDAAVKRDLIADYWLKEHARGRIINERKLEGAIQRGRAAHDYLIMLCPWHQPTHFDFQRARSLLRVVAVDVDDSRELPGATLPEFVKLA